MTNYKVIFHINESDKWNTILNNVSNLLKAFSKEQVEIIVLANGESVRYYESEPISTNDHAQAMKELSEKGVHFVACNNALKGRKIAKDALYPFIETVPAGVQELVIRQHEGYAYIKP